MRFGFIARHATVWPVAVQCTALGVSRSGYYAWRRLPPSPRATRDAAITTVLRATFAATASTYGVRRMWPEVRAAGHSVGRERVRRLMQAAALRARPRRRVPRPLGADTPALVAPNVLGRAFAAMAPNQKWVADFTYVWTLEGWLFVAVVLDLFSRRIVGWAMSPAHTSDLVGDALLMAVQRRAPGHAVPGTLLLHSDQGAQYTSDAYQRLLRPFGIRCSMSRAGNVWDHAAMESFFSSLKTERCRHHTYATRDEARADIFDYIERFYNPVRRHSKLGYLSPVAYEQQAQQQSVAP